MNPCICGSSFCPGWIEQRDAGSLSVEVIRRSSPYLPVSDLTEGHGSQKLVFKVFFISEGFFWSSNFPL